MPASHIPNQKSTSADLLNVEPISELAGSTSALGDLLNNGSCRVKEERALIQCRTVEPAIQLKNCSKTFRGRSATLFR